MKIGAQLYTLRDFCKTEEEFASTLSRVADMGYTTLQVSGTCEYKPEWLRKQLQKNGLKCVLTHIPCDRLESKTDDVINDHTEFGCKNIGLGWFGFDGKENTVKTFTEKFKPITKKLKDGGKYFMYHNHDGEFAKEGDDIILSKLAEAFSAEEMGFTLDTFWVQAGGGDPAQWIERLHGRVPCIHLKDFAYGKKMAVIGEGNINFDRVFEKAEGAGTEYMLVEQDDCYGEDPFECLKRSFKYLHSLGFE